MKWSQRFASDGSPAAAVQSGSSQATQYQLQKKACGRREQERVDVARARRRWMREQGMFDPARLVFIDRDRRLTPQWCGFEAAARAASD